MNVGLYLTAALGPLGAGILGVVLTVFVLAYQRLKHKNQLLEEFVDPLITKLLLVLLVLSLAAIIFSRDPAMSFAVVAGQVLMVFFGILGGRYLVGNPLVRSRVLLVTAISLGISATVVLFKYLYFSLPRSSTLFSDSVNATGSMLVLFSGVTLAYLWSLNTTKSKIGTVILYLLTLLAVLATGSRGAFLGYIGLSLVLLAFNKRGMIILLGVALVLSTAMLINENWRERYSRLSISQNMDRIYIYQTSLNMMKDKPILGVGPGTFGSQYSEYKPPEEHVDAHCYAHNLYLQIGSEYGIPALIVFLSITLLVFWYGFRLTMFGDLVSRGLLASYVGTMIHQMFDIAVWRADLGSVFWLVIGAIIAAYVKTRSYTAKAEINQAC